MDVLPPCMSVHHIHAWWLPRPQKSLPQSGTGVTSGCEPPRGCREVQLSPLEEHSAPLTLMSSLQPHITDYLTGTYGMLLNKFKMIIRRSPFEPSSTQQQEVTTLFTTHSGKLCD